MSILLILVGFVIYFIPAIVAWNRMGFNGIFVLNLILGWTLLGWVAALIWAVQSPRA